MRGGMQLMVLGVALTAIPVGVAEAQWAARNPDSPRQVVVSASASVEVTPNRARLVLAVESRGRTGALAASENARVQNAVLAAVRDAGIASAQIRTLAVTVNPEYRYPSDGGRPTVVGYQARNSIRVEVHDLARVAAAIDGALGAGATNVSGPTLYLDDEAGARREALQLAVRKARADAEAMAEAAGATLGPILEMSASDDGGMPEPMRGMALSRAAGDGSTPVEAGNLTIRATVNLRIALVQR